jgi:hypothetical protein
LMMWLTYLDERSASDFTTFTKAVRAFILGTRLCKQWAGWDESEPRTVSALDDRGRTFSGPAGAEKVTFGLGR